MKKILIFLFLIYLIICKKDCGYNQIIVCTDFHCKNCYCMMDSFKGDDYPASKTCGDSKRPVCYDKDEFRLECYPPGDSQN